MSRSASWVVAVGASLAMATMAGGTVVTPVDDAVLAAASEAVVIGTVRRVGSFRTPRRGIVTRVRLGVREVLAGGVGRRQIVMTLPGGDLGTTSVRVVGVDPPSVGDEVLVFLRRTRDGELRPTGLPLGTHRLLRTVGGTFAVPGMPGAPVRSLETVRAALVGRPPLRTLAPAASVLPAFSFLTRIPARWTKADRGRRVKLRVAQHDPLLGPAATLAALDEALAVWTDVPSATIVLGRGRRSRVRRSAAGDTCDRRSIVQFDDPLDEIGSLRGCRGVLGITGICGVAARKSFRDVGVFRITEADVTLNAGITACLGEVGVREVLAHEVGHAIGLGHSSERAGEPDPTLADATMFFLVHGDGRGAALRADDVAGATWLYPAAD